MKADRLDALGAARRQPVLVDRRALAVAVLGHDEQVLAGARDVHREHEVALARDVHAAHAAGAAAHRPGVALAEADGEAGMRDHQDLVVRVDPADRDELVVLADVDRDDPVGLDRRVVERELGLLDDAVAGPERQVRRLGEVARREHGLDALVLAQRQHVAEVAALRRAAGLRQVVDLRAVDLAAVREEQQVVVRRAHEEVLDVVVVLEVHAGDADPAAALLAVGRERQRLDVAGVRDRDDHLLVGDQVLDVEVVLGRRDDRAPLVAVALRDLEQLLLDQAEDLLLVAEQLAQLADPLDLVGVLALDRVGLERGQLLQPQLEDRLGLDVAQAEALDQAAAGGCRGRASRGSARSPRRGCRARSAGPRGGGPAPRACAARASRGGR